MSWLHDKINMCHYKACRVLQPHLGTLIWCIQEHTPAEEGNTDLKIIITK